MLALVTVTLAGCETSVPGYFGTVRPKHPPDVLWMNNGGEPQWIDPGKCADSNGGDVIWNTFAGLVEAHPATLDPMPEIARDWTISADGTVYTFYLRESTWSDGQELTAADFEWSWKRLLDPTTASKYAYIAYPLKNAEPFNLRAFFLTGVPSDTPAETVQDFIAALAPVERVEPAVDPDGFFVYVGGEEDEIAANREKVLTGLKDLNFNGHALQIQVADQSLVGVKAVDAETLRVELQTPIPYFLNLLSFYSFMPVPRHVIETFESQGLNADLWTRPENIVSNGAYLLKDWKFRQYMLFEKNPRYWNAQIVRTPRIKATMVESYNTALNLYTTGEMDFPGGNTQLPAEFMDHLKKYNDFRRDPYMAAYFYWFNTKQPPMDNIKVRQALSLSVDRESIVKHVTRAGQIPTAQLVPDGLAGYQGLNRTLFDPEEARQLLAEAGYPGGQDLPQITLIYNTSETHKQIAEAVQQMWKKHLGIQVNIENQEWKVYLKRLEMMDFQIARMGWIGDYADPYTFLDLLLPSAGNNHSNWIDERYAETLRQANRTLEREARLQMLREAEQYMLDHQPLLPIYVYTRTQMIKPYVRGIWGNFQDRHLWKYLWIDKRWYEGVPAEPGRDAPPPMIERT